MHQFLDLTSTNTFEYILMQNYKFIIMLKKNYKKLKTESQLYKKLMSFWLYLSHSLDILRLIDLVNTLYGQSSINSFKKERKNVQHQTSLAIFYGIQWHGFCKIAQRTGSKLNLDWIA